MKIYTFVNNKPDLLELQLRSFQRNLKEPFEFIVIDNSFFGGNQHPSGAGSIGEECNRLNLPRISIYYFDRALGDKCFIDSGDRVLSGDRYTHMTMGCMYGVRWAWENVISQQRGKILLMHHDMFLMEPASLSEYLGDAALAFVPQVRKGIPVHLWEGFTLANLDILPDAGEINWSYGTIDGVRTDVGGMSHYWFQSHPDVKWKGIRPNHIEDTPEVDFHPSLFEYLYFDERPLVLHYRAASDWMKMGPEYHQRKTDWLRRQLA